MAENSKNKQTNKNKPENKILKTLHSSCIKCYFKLYLSSVFLKYLEFLKIFSFQPNAYAEV